MSADWQILHANSASHRLLGGAAGGLLGRDIRSYIPALGTVPTIGETRQTFRTEMQCPAKREEGEIFLANVYFSTYNTAKGPRMAALVVDASEELRQREELSLEQLMAGSRILVGAVSHEIRNVCSTINVVYENLVRGSRLNGNQDFEALGSLVEILNKVASLELKQSSSSSQVNDVDLREVLDKLRIVLDSYCQEANILLEWNVPDVLPRVLADSDRLLQVLLNLAKNSERALKDATIKKLKISVSMSGYGASIRVSDTGPGIRSTENLFQPFQRGADSTGLGLYLSRAFLRSFNGDLHHDPEMPGCSFVIDLAISEASPK